MSVDLFQGDCLELMKDIPDGSVDMVLTDPTYGRTNAKWDVVIPFEPLWAEYKRIVKQTGAICIFGSEPFSTYLRMSNIENFKYDWIWVKNRCSGFLHAKNAPLKAHEIISVFSCGSVNHPSKTDHRMEYNPQFSPGKPWKRFIKSNNIGGLGHHGQSRNEYVGKEYHNDKRYPKSVLHYSIHNGGLYHPTQKPVALLEYLIRTYTNEGEIVLDNCMGSGSTGVACVNTGRSFIGMELDPGYFETAKRRIEEAQEQFRIAAV